MSRMEVSKGFEKYGTAFDGGRSKIANVHNSCPKYKQLLLIIIFHYRVQAYVMYTKGKKIGSKIHLKHIFREFMFCLLFII